MTTTNTFDITAEQSTAVSRINFIGNQVEITYTSNPTKTYTFTAEEQTLSDLLQVVQSVAAGGDQSIGKTLHSLIRTEQLKPVQ